MSVLSFPRIYFNGYAAWDPITANNNDHLPVNDAANADLFWDYLSTQGISRPTTPEEWDGFRDLFQAWAIEAHLDSCPPAEGAVGADTCNSCGPLPTPPAPDNPDQCHMASRWDYFGGAGMWLVQYPGGNKETTVNGGAYFDDTTGKVVHVSSDPIIGQQPVITGDTFGGHASFARFIDTNPMVPWSTQIYFGEVNLGGFLHAPRHLRMHSRSFFVPRNISSDLIIAGAIGVFFQTTFPYDSLTLDDGGSDLMRRLIAAMQDRQAGANGLMLRFAAYNTLYYQNGIFNEQDPVPDCDTLSRLYREGKVFRNPAYSQLTGSFGVWQGDELATAPGGHFLVPNAAFSPAPEAPAAPESRVHGGKMSSVRGHGGLVFEEASASAASGPPPMAFGAVFAEIDYEHQLVSVDLGNATREHSTDGEKLDYGQITVGISVETTFHPIGSFAFADYDKQAYDAAAGIVDVPFTAATGDQIKSWLQDGLVALEVQGEIGSLERPLTAQTDSRGIYLDEGCSRSFEIQVAYRNQPPPADKDAYVLLAEYYPWMLNVGAGSWVLSGQEPPAGGPDGEFCTATPSGPYVEFADGAVIPVVEGSAKASLRWAQPGFPVVAFYPFLVDRGAEPIPPTPQTYVGFGFEDGVTTYQTIAIDNAYYTTVRCLPADNSLLQEFADCWNATGSYAGRPQYDRTAIWQWIYSNILWYFNVLYPVMDEYMPLGNLPRVEGAIDQLLQMVTVEMEKESTLYMPISRELSAAKRAILESWGDLVVRKYPPQPIEPPAVSCP